MLSLVPSVPSDRPLRVLCLGAHCDDIEIGCGGTVLALTEQLRNVSVDWVVLSSTPEREREARASADIFLDVAKEKSVVVKSFRDGFFPYVGGEIKEEFERLKGTCAPDLILTHYRNDLGADLEHLPESPDPGIRDPQVRRRSGSSEPVRAARRIHRSAEDRHHPETLPQPGRPVVVLP